MRADSTTTLANLPSIEAAPARPGPTPPLLVEDVVARWWAIMPFVAVGTVCTIAGGLVAAVSRPTNFGHGPWLAAYLVLVGGVGQIGLGAGQALLAGRVPSQGVVRVEVVSWNAGLLGVIIGTLVPSPLLTTVGSAATALALTLFVRSVRTPGRLAPLARGAFLALAVTLLVSLPIGVVLTWARHG